jgi:hypothetical protein
MQCLAAESRQLGPRGSFANGDERKEAQCMEYERVILERLSICGHAHMSTDLNHQSQKNGTQISTYNSQAQHGNVCSTAGPFLDLLQLKPVDWNSSLKAGRFATI